MNDKPRPEEGAEEPNLGQKEAKQEKVELDDETEEDEDDEEDIEPLTGPRPPLGKR